MTQESNQMDLAGSATPADANETVVSKTASDSVEETADETVGVAHHPTDDVLPDTFRMGVVSELRNFAMANDHIADMGTQARVATGLVNHLQREAMKYTASRICKLTEELLNKGE